MVDWYSPEELLDIVERTYLTAYASNIPPPDIFMPVIDRNAYLRTRHRLLRNRVTEKRALALYGRLIDRSAIIDTPESQLLQLIALNQKAVLLNLMERNQETIKVCDLLLNLCDARRDIVPLQSLSYFKASAFTSKGLALLRE